MYSFLVNPQGLSKGKSLTTTKQKGVGSTGTNIDFYLFTENEGLQACI